MFLCGDGPNLNIPIEKAAVGSKIKIMTTIILRNRLFSLLWKSAHHLEAKINYKLSKSSINFKLCVIYLNI